MTTTHELANPTTGTVANVAEYLATGYIALSCAAITAEQLVACDPAYVGAAGWDLQTGILDAATDVENAARVHDLSQHHGFWKDPQPPTQALTVLASHHAQDPQSTARWLVVELGAAFTHLSRAADHAETLVTADHCYDHHHGYVGGLGWDLQTAIDDAIIALRDTMRVNNLASINPEFWADKL